jgi:hypothetical protein
MKKVVLIFVFLFALTSSYANNFSSVELKSSTIKNVSIENSIDNIAFNDFDFKSLSIEIKAGSCTISASGSIAGFSISISVTASSCKEALAELRSTIKEVKAMFK